MADFMPILGGATALMNLLGPLFQGQGSTENINPYTEQIMAQLQSALGDAQGRQRGFESQATDAATSVGDQASQIRQTAGDIANVSQPSANAWFDQWLQNVPEYQQIASNFAEQSVQQLGQSLQEQAKLQQQQALEQVAQQFGGAGFSGAAASAAGAGAAAPIAAAQSQLAGKQADIGSGLFNSLSGQGQGLAQSGTQNQFQNAINALTQQMAGQSTALQGTAQQGQMFQGLAGQQGNLIGQLFGALGNEGTQVFQNKPSQLGQIMAGATQGMNNIFNMVTDPNNAGIFNDPKNIQPNVVANPSVMPTGQQAFQSAPAFNGGFQNNNSFSFDPYNTQKPAPGLSPQLQAFLASLQ